MAYDGSHAATQHDRTFTVEIVSGEETETALAGELGDFFEAVDCAMDWLEREDPARSSGASIGIFEISDGVREQVWAYPSDPGSTSAGAAKPLVELFGFDPVAWKAPATEYEHAPMLPVHRGTPAPTEPLATFVAAVAEPDPVEVPDPAAEPERVRERALRAAGERLGAWLESGNRLRLHDGFFSVWHDTLSRVCLLFGAVCLWLTLTLAEPAFLAPLVAAVAGLWLRRGHRAVPAGDEIDDWF